MKIWICPRCSKHGIKAEGYTYCVSCRNARQRKMRQAKKVKQDELVTATTTSERKP